MKSEIPISAVHVRTTGFGESRRVEVLVELRDEWRLIQSHPWHSVIDGEISHITESLGIAESPLQEIRR